ncbi:MAG: hypothetical protein R2698_05120 [Microthrixaceae bacterium]
MTSVVVALFGACSWIWIHLMGRSTLRVVTAPARRYADGGRAAGRRRVSVPGRRAAAALRWDPAAAAFARRAAAEIEVGATAAQAAMTTAGEWECGTVPFVDALVSASGHRRFDEALAAARRVPARPGWDLVAVALDLGHRFGGGTADALRSVADAVSEAVESEDELATLTAQARASATLLGVLPVFGLLVTAGIDRRSIVFLIATTPGRICLLGGAVLNLVGRRWIARIVRIAP